MESRCVEPAGSSDRQLVDDASDSGHPGADGILAEQALNDDAAASSSNEDLGGADAPETTELDGDQSVDEELKEKQKILEEEVDEEKLTKAQADWSTEELDSARQKAKEAKDRGNTQFLSEGYFDAVKSYTEALQMCPVKFPKDRAMIYQNRGACKVRLDQYELAIKDLTRAVELDPNYFKARLKRAQVYEKAEKLDEALKDYEQLLSMDPRHKESLEACRRLPDKINERNEKLKTEMMSKLKDLGNLVLRPFGLSTDSFSMQQDPNTGGYSISMQNKS